MPTSVRVDDYYDNNENGLWSWYLKNIRSGDFEELTTNELKFTLLKRFLNSKIYNNNNNNNNDNNNDTTPLDKNKKILLISIPDKVHSDISILETFLKDYFHLEDLQNIKIQKLTQDHCYNHENHYLLIDQMNNFNDPTFLNYVDPKRYNKFKAETSKIDETETEQTEQATDEGENIAPQITLHDESGNEIVSQEKIINSSNNNSKSINSVSPTIETSFSSNNTSESSNNNNSNSNNALTNSSIISDDAASSIVLNFPRAPLHHIRHTKDNQPSSPANNSSTKKQIKRDSVDSLLHSVFTNGNNGHSFTPPGSELVSINSFYNDEETSFVEDDHAINKHPLTRMITPDEEEEERENEHIEENLPPLTATGLTESDIIPTTNSNSNSNTNNNNNNNVILNSNSKAGMNDNESFVSSVSSDSYSSYSTSSSISSASSYYSILPSISINDQCGHFRLVLQSALLYNENKEIFTAIRQSNNVVNKASVKDDWILYDSEFSMNNLMMLTLKELFEFGHDIPKILFYSMVIVDPIQPLSPTSNKELPSLIPTDADIVRVSNEFNDNLEIKEDSDNELLEDNTNAKPEMLYDDNEDEPKMYIPERMISNVTTAGHRSIRTVNSIGEWAYRKKSNVSGITYDNDHGDSDTDKYFPDDNDNNINIKNGNSDVERRNKIERWKSLPNHNNNLDDDSTLNPNGSGSGNHSNNRSTGHKNKRYNDGIIHSGGERWKLNMKRFKKSSDRKNEDDKFCIIM
ncbi:protein Gis4p [Monosporozyma unispora]